jgi:hypothetical protein
MLSHRQEASAQPVTWLAVAYLKILRTTVRNMFKCATAMRIIQSLLLHRDVRRGHCKAKELIPCAVKPFQLLQGTLE